MEKKTGDLRLKTEAVFALNRKKAAFILFNIEIIYRTKRTLDFYICTSLDVLLNCFSISILLVCYFSVYILTSRLCTSNTCGWPEPSGVATVPLLRWQLAKPSSRVAGYSLFSAKEISFKATEH